jgi:hypothetical protein
MMRLPDHCLDPLIEGARTEAERCKVALAEGSPADFWRWRLGDYLGRLESAAAIIREQLAAVPSTAPSQPEDDCG